MSGRSSKIEALNEARMRRWQEEDCGSKDQRDAVRNPFGSDSRLARTTDEAAKAEELPDEDGLYYSQSRNHQRAFQRKATLVFMIYHSIGGMRSMSSHLIGILQHLLLGWLCSYGENHRPCHFSDMFNTQRFWNASCGLCRRRRITYQLVSHHTAR